MELSAPLARYLGDAIAIAPLSSVVFAFVGARSARRLGHRRLAGALYVGGAAATPIAAFSLAPRPLAQEAFRDLAQFALVHYFAICIFCFVAYVAGRRLTNRVAYDSVWEQVGVSTALGLGVLALMVYIVGLFGWLYPPVLLSLGCLMLLLGREVVLEVASGLKHRGRPRSDPELLIAAVVALLVAPVFLLPLYPPTDFDATLYHLVYAKRFSVDHQVEYLTYVRSPVFPQLFEMLFTAMMAFLDDIGAKLAHIAACLLVVVLTYSWGRRIFRARVGLWAAALCLGSPLLLWEAGSAYIDAGLMLFATGSLYALCIWLTGREMAWLLLAGVFAGLAAATKYTGLTILFVGGLIVLVGSIQARTYRPLLIFGAVAAVPITPFYVRILADTGNPVWPFLSPIFGYGPWSPDDYRANLDSMFAARGLGTDPAALIRLPWYLMIDPDRFGSAPPIVTPLHLLLACAVPIGLTDARSRLLFGIVISALLAWFYTAQDTRYLLPILPVGSVLVANSLDRSLGLLPRDWRKLAVPLADASLCASVALLGFVYARGRIERYGYPPATAEARHAYLADQLPAYDAIRWLNEHVENYRAYQLYEEGMTYFFDGEVIGDWFGPGRYADVTGAATSGQSLRAKLRSLAATHLVVSSRHEFELPDDSVSRASFHRVYGARGVTVYELRDPEVPGQAETRESVSVER